MKDYKKIEAKELKDNVFELIGHDWMLVTAGKKDHFNTMTASWGAMGILFNKPVAIIFIRPQRYTNEFIKEESHFTLSVLPEQYRNALTVCGRKSGRDCDKVAEAGLTPIETENGNIAFGEGRLILECKKIYADQLDAKAFIDNDLIAQNFPNSDFHDVYIATIENVWCK